ncbi:MAG TPA: ATP12 family protein [Pseudolabrys sp.]|nr:ATP12 family protein [Pseudolabrys sp.]
MRDIFADLFENQPLDPMVSARQGARASLRKRFYQEVQVGPNAGEDAGESFLLLLDGKQVMTPARRALAAPVKPLAELIAQEWDEQSEVIDPARMPLTRLANVILDGIADAPTKVSDEIEKYLGSDLLCYRADAPPALVERQTKCWNPVLNWARDERGARFVQVEGVVFTQQPAEAIAAARGVIPTNVWRLGAVASVTMLTGSALLALALNAGAFDADSVWAAANVDEDWQMSHWGSDDEALKRRASRRAEFNAAVAVLKFV